MQKRFLQNAVKQYLRSPLRIGLFAVVAIVLVSVPLVYAATQVFSHQSPLHKELELGERFLMEGDYQQAEIQFNNVLTQDSQNADALFGLAKLYFNQQQYTKAQEILPLIQLSGTQNNPEYKTGTNWDDTILRYKDTWNGQRRTMTFESDGSLFRASDEYLDEQNRTIYTIAVQLGEWYITQIDYDATTAVGTQTLLFPNVNEAYSYSITVEMQSDTDYIFLDSTEGLFGSDDNVTVGYTEYNEEHQVVRQDKQVVSREMWLPLQTDNKENN